MSAPVVVDQADELVTLECEQCGDPITGKARGAGSARWKMGTHLRVKHGIQGRGRKKRGQPSEAEHEAHPVIGAIREAAADVGVGKKGTPNAEELAAGLGKGLHIATMGAATLLATTDPTITHDDAGDALRSQIVDNLTLNLAAAKGVMTPVGRMFATSSLNKRYGRAVVDNVDVLGSMFDVALLARSWFEYFNWRRERMERIREHQAGQPQLSMAPAPAPEQAAQTVPAPAGTEYTPGPSQGRVLSAEDVQAMTRKAS